MTPGRPPTRSGSLAFAVCPEPGSQVPSASFLDALAATGPRLYAWAHVRIRGDLRRWLEPADLVQEVAVRACVRQASYDPARGTFRAWLFGFANRVWLETLRELSRAPTGARRRRGGDSALGEILESVTSMTQRVARQESLQAAMARLDELDDDDRQLASLLGLEGLSHIEAAAVLGIAADTCRKRWQRLRERLQAEPALAAWFQA